MKVRNYILITAIATTAILLQACDMVDETNTNLQYPPPPATTVNNYMPPQYHDNQIKINNSDIKPQPKKVTVPDSALLSDNGPQLHRDVDKNWISKQNPQGYTIELINDEKAATVAKTLYNTPKNERTAEVKYLKDGKPMYTGVYGSYKDKESAEKALQQLPPGIKDKASINQWSKVQEQTKEQ